MTDAPNNSLASINDALVQKCRELAKMCREHGQRLEKALNEHADRLANDQQEMASAILAADRDMKDDIAAFIGTSRIAAATKAIEDELRGMTRQ